MSTAFMGELLGTMTLILFGNTVNAGVILKDTYAHDSGWIVITTGWGLAVIFGVTVALVVGSNAHINPAVTVGVATATGEWAHVGTYIAGQMLGAMLGAVLVWVHYYPHWARTDDPAGKRACFCTSPAIPNVPANMISEIIGTFMLVLVATAIFSDNLSPGGPPPGVGPFLVGLLVWCIGLGIGGTTGYAINPARDLGPRIVHAVLPISGKGDSGWDYAAIPVAGPVIGAVLAGLVVSVLQI